MLSIILPSRDEKFLNRTIQDLLDKATGEIEIFPVLDGHNEREYKPIVDKRVEYIRLPNPHPHEWRKRQAINVGVSLSRGKYICWMDAHCAMAKGFDEVLANDCEDNWVLVPRRYKMNLNNWDRELQGSHPFEDYRYWIWSYLKHDLFEPWRWGRRALERKNIMIDDIFLTQASFFFMTRKHFDRMGFMQLKGYTGFLQESQEVCLTTLFNGGRVVIDKNTWYAHVSKKQMPAGQRGYKTKNKEPSYNYAFNYWVHEHKDFFIDLINKNMPIPNYPTNWVDKIYGS